MNLSGSGNGASNPWAVLGIPPPAANAAAGEQPQPAANPLLAQILQTMMNPALAANPQLAFLAMQLLQGQQPQLQQPQPAPQTHQDTSSHSAPQQMKEKIYCDAQSEQVDTTLALFISAGQSAGESKFVALENMNTRHGYSAEWWKDYYLVHQTRIDVLVASFNGQAFPTPTQTQPGSSQPSKPSSSLESIKRRRSPSASSSILDITDEVLASSSGRPLKASRRMRDHEEASSSAFNAHKTDLNVPSMLPTVPPSSPTPVKFAEGKFRFTPEDEAFFVNLILWHAKTTPGANKANILLDLVAKAPQHPINSWGNFWTTHKANDILERGLRMARVEAATGAIKTEALEHQDDTV